MTQLKITAKTAKMLGSLTTRDEAGRHFYEFAPDLSKYEAVGLVRISRPVHPTGIEYDGQYHSVEVCPLVSDWFDAHGNIYTDDFPRIVTPDDCAAYWPEIQIMTTIKITAQSGYAWTEDVEDIEAAISSILEEHDDIDNICTLVGNKIGMEVYNHDN